MNDEHLPDVGSDQPRVTTTRVKTDSEQAWALDRALAVVITAPPSIHSHDAQTLADKWRLLREDFNIEISRLVRHAFPDATVEPSRETYRRALPDTGGMWPDLSELQTIARDANALVQDLSGWITMAEIARQIPGIWRDIVLRRGEHGGVHPEIETPLLSLPWIKALCVADIDQKYGISSIPYLAAETRANEGGNAEHPIGLEHHLIVAGFGLSIRQYIAYIVDSHGAMLEKFGIRQDTTMVLDLLDPTWYGGRNRFTTESNSDQ